MTPARKVAIVVTIVIVMFVVAWTVTVVLFKAGGSTEGPRRLASHTIAA